MKMTTKKESNGSINKLVIGYNQLDCLRVPFGSFGQGTGAPSFVVAGWGLWLWTVFGRGAAILTNLQRCFYGSTKWILSGLDSCFCRI